jgi:hypothetical protein
VMIEPFVAEAGPDFVIDRSAVAALNDVTAVALLFPAVGSDVVLLTVAVLERLVPAKDGGVENVLVIVFDWPAVIVPSEQGKGVVQAPALEMKFAPAGSGSVTLTAAASEGPLLVTVIV